VEDRIEDGLSERFGYRASVVVRSHEELRAVVQGAPDGFGHEPDRFRYTVLFLREPLAAADALAQISSRDGVDVATVLAMLDERVAAAGTGGAP
jgi:uncharacterized protein (DUF1697 family)